MSIEADNINTELERAVRVINGQLEKHLKERDDIHSALLDAVSYALLAPGKRIRSTIVQWVCRMLCGEIKAEAIVSGCAIEMMHTYSLVHDDLPAMDNDDLRRGRATVHIKYGEATAILAGDALQSMALEILATDIKDSSKALKLIGILTGFSGAGGMISGQIADMQAEQNAVELADVEYIHHHKTAMMFAAAAAMGAVCANADSKDVNLMMQWGLTMGLCFQITDDILDVESTTEQMGKTVGKDSAAGKATWPAVAGMEVAKARAANLTSQAEAMLAPYGEKAAPLSEMVMMLLKRTM
ncbi:MAG: polyprenyl synthetase family protein [Phycisphaerae bacterium]|jgi:geranylgeranyl pyrophosphate synthase